MSWNYLISFIGHEMFKRMKKSILEIVNKQHIHDYDLRKATIEMMLEYLEKQNVDEEQREYVRRLINISLRMFTLSILYNNCDVFNIYILSLCCFTFCSGNYKWMECWFRFCTTKRLGCNYKIN